MHVDKLCPAQPPPLWSSSPTLITGKTDSLYMITGTDVVLTNNPSERCPEARAP